MAFKKFMVSCTFPNLPSGIMYASASVEAPDFGRAADFALREIRKRPNYKGRRLKQVKFDVTDLNADQSE